MATSICLLLNFFVLVVFLAEASHDYKPKKAAAVEIAAQVTASSRLLEVIRDDVEPQQLPAESSRRHGEDSHPKGEHIKWTSRLLPVAVLGGVIAIHLTRWAHSGGSTRSLDKHSLSNALVVFFACLVYFVSGPALIILNKYIMTTLAFPYPIMVANLGLASMLIVTQMLVRSGFWPLKQTELDNTSFYGTVLPLAVFACSSLILGNWVYLYLSVPLIQMLKCTTVVYVMLLGIHFGIERLTKQLVVSIAAIVLGLVLAVAHDVGMNGQFSGAFLFGIAVMTGANLSEAGRSVFTQISMERFAFMDSMYWCTPSMVLLNTFFVICFELRGVCHASYSKWLLACLAGSAFLGGITNFSNFWLTKLVGGLTMKVMVNARNIVLILFSVIAFGEACTAMQYVGYAIALGGLAIYNEAKSPLPAEQQKLDCSKVEKQRMQVSKV